MLNKLFKLDERKSNVKTEMYAGMITFFSMAYILIVNPLILSDAGMPKDAVFSATCLAAIFGSVVMGLYANYPVALAPGMGMNAFFTYTVVIGMGYTWQDGLFAIFVSGLLFLLLSFSGLRKQIINMIPMDLKHSISVGIGFFIAFIGLKLSGIIVGNPDTLVSLGDLSNPITLLSLFGLILLIILVTRKMRMAFITTMVITCVIGIIMQISGIDMGIVMPENGIISLPPSITPVFGKFLTESHPLALLTDFNFWLVVISLLFVSFFDATGSLVAVGMESGLVDDEGNLMGSDRALKADGIAVTSSAIFGTTSVATFIESLAGIKAGGRTGLTAVAVALFFAIALFFSGVVYVVTSAVTAPVLIVVGIMMAQHNKDINFSDWACNASSFLTVIFMVTTYSISEGIAIGFISYTLIRVAEGRGRELHVLMYILSGIFLLHYFL